MLVTQKMLKMNSRSKLCLVIHLEDGTKVQYPVRDEAEAQAKYEEYQRWNLATLTPSESHV
jgi:hypothetical protein